MNCINKKSDTITQKMKQHFHGKKMAAFQDLLKESNGRSSGKIKEAKKAIQNSTSKALKDILEKLLSKAQMREELKREELGKFIYFKDNIILS